MALEEHNPAMAERGQATVALWNLAQPGALTMLRGRPIRRRGIR